MTESVEGKSLRSLWLPYLLDIVGPFAAYLVVTGFGIKAIWALTAGGVVAAAATTVNTVRRKGLDAVGGLVVAEMVASILLMIYVRDPRLVLIRPSFYTGIAAVYLVISAFGKRPLTYVGSRPMAANGGPLRLVAYEQAWEKSPRFRRIHRVLTCGFGLGLAADSILRIVIVYHSSTNRAAWISNLPHTVAIIVMVVLSAIAGRTFARLVDEQMATMPASDSKGKSKGVA